MAHHHHLEEATARHHRLEEAMAHHRLEEATARHHLAVEGMVHPHPPEDEVMIRFHPCPCSGYSR